MNSIIIINKPTGYTSRDVVNIICKKYGTKKVGHTGTLDPLATGVLVTCIGKYTKLVELITSFDKEYIAEITLGISTDTLDITGNVLEVKDASKITKDSIIKTITHFKGIYMQEVPIYSAVKVKGKKLYEYARNKENVELPKKEVSINSIEVVGDIKYVENKIIFSIKTNVSKGTYIRSLIKDIGDNLNIPSCMSALIRTKQGKFTIEDASNIDSDRINEININEIFDFKMIEISDENLKKQILNGAIIDNVYNESIVGFKIDGNLISIYREYNKDNTKLKPYKML